MRLIQIEKEDYIIVDGFEVKKGDYIYESDQNNINIVGHDYSKNNKDFRITYSTKPLEDIIVHNKYNAKGWVNIKQLSLSEVEELLFGYSAKKLANLHCEEQNRLGNDCNYDSFIKGLNTHKELAKNKLFTVDDMRNVFILGGKHKVQNPDTFLEKMEKIIQSLQPTEWEVEFINGKLTLKQ